MGRDVHSNHKDVEGVSDMSIETSAKENKKNISHIVYATDDKFAEILGVSLVSLYYNCWDMEDIVVYILDSGISELNRKKLCSVAKQYNRHDLIFIQAKNISEELSMDVAIDRGSLSQYARLFVSSDLPQDLDRVLYLDCDIIINQSIGRLWNIDMKGKTIAAFMDAFSKYYRVNIDLQPDDVMFNSGVMLIDLNRWNEQKVEKRLLDFIAKKNGKIQQGDQGALNAVLSHDTYCFEPKFNTVTIFYDFSYKEMLIYRKPPKFYKEETIKKAIENPVIIHFTTSFLSKRPWMIGCQHRYVDVWMKYKMMSPWKDEPLWEDNRPGWKLKGAEVISRLPRRIGIRLAGFMQVYGRPIVNKIKGN